MQGSLWLPANMPIPTREEHGYIDGRLLVAKRRNLPSLCQPVSGGRD